MKRKRIKNAMNRQTLSSPFGNAGHVSANPSFAGEAQVIVREILISLNRGMIKSKKETE